MAPPRSLHLCGKGFPKITRKRGARRRRGERTAGRGWGGGLRVFIGNKIHPPPPAKRGISPLKPSPGAGPSEGLSPDWSELAADAFPADNSSRRHLPPPRFPPQKSALPSSSRLLPFSPPSLLPTLNLGGGREGSCPPPAPRASFLGLGSAAAAPALPPGPPLPPPVPPAWNWARNWGWNGENGAGTPCPPPRHPPASGGSSQKGSPLF